MMSLITSAVPILLRQVQAVPKADKQEFALFLRDLCNAYAEGDQPRFVKLLGKTHFPVEWKRDLEKALFGYEDQA